MMITEIIMDGLLAAIAGIGFGAISHPPRRAFLYIGILAAVGHALRYYLMHALQIDIAAASFCASLVIGLFTLWFGRITYCPMTVLYIPALLPMVPGMYAYKTVFGLMMFMQHLKDETLAPKYLQESFSNAVVTVSTVFLLALGATLMIFIFPKRAYSMTRK
ncbi:MAG TPA: threonine/serine exporter family protein [Bacteroidales bacterium]|nr:threonine/serine exporter family protein [Bacteroidales bacterium]